MTNWITQAYTVDECRDIWIRDRLLEGLVVLDVVMVWETGRRERVGDLEVVVVVGERHCE